MSPQERDEKARDFVNKIGLTWEDLDTKKRTRVTLLMSEDFTWSPHRGLLDPPNETTTFAKEFSQFCDNLGMVGEGWRDCSRVFFEPAAMHQFLVMCQQKTGTCCLHAAVVFQHYVQCLRIIITHAVVMIGAYKDEATDTVWFLLQNFWKGGYFRLVSAEYVASTFAIFLFVRGPHVDVTLKRTFATLDAQYAESAFEIPEEYAEEPCETI